MRQLVAQAAALDRFIADRGWAGCIIGGVANLRWGEPRLTRDVDATIITGFGGEGPYIHALLEAFRPRIPDAAAFASENRVVLLESADGIPMDVALGRRIWLGAFGRWFLTRASRGISPAATASTGVTGPSVAAANANAPFLSQRGYG